MLPGYDQPRRFVHDVDTDDFLHNFLMQNLTNGLDFYARSIESSRAELYACIA